jgi:hypothetical protein
LKNKKYSFTFNSRITSVSEKKRNNVSNKIRPLKKYKKEPFQDPKTTQIYQALGQSKKAQSRHEKSSKPLWTCFLEYKL